MDFESATHSVRDIATLRQQKRDDFWERHHLSVMTRLAEETNEGLIIWLSTTGNPLHQWLINQELTTRGVPPVLRWPSNEASPQARFITWLADIAWFRKKVPKPHYGSKSWKRFYKMEVDSDEWHQAAFALYEYGLNRSANHQFWLYGIGLDLEGNEDLRSEMINFNTNKIRKQRSQLLDFWDVYGEPFKTYAMEHRDTSGKNDPFAVAYRRLKLYRLHILAGGVLAKTTRYYSLLTGNPISRQAISKQLLICADIVQAHRRRQRNLIRDE